MFRIADAYFKGETLDGEVGIEIELEGTNLPREVGGGAVWTVTRDGSLRDEAYEYVLSVPIERKAVKGALSSLYERLNRSVLTDSGRAGVHVHVNIRDLTPHQLYNFILLYLVFEKNLVNFCGEDRVGNLFCLRAIDAEFLLVNIRKLMRTHDFSLTKTDTLRYAAMNLTSILKYGSLEFRAMASPVTQKKIEDWVRLLLRLKDFAIELESPTNVVLGVSELGGADFAQDVFKGDLPLLSSDDWRSDVMDGMRLIQPLANTFDEKALGEWVEKHQERLKKEAEAQAAHEAALAAANNGSWTAISTRHASFTRVNDWGNRIAASLGDGHRLLGNFQQI